MVSRRSIQFLNVLVAIVMMQVVGLADEPSLSVRRSKGDQFPRKVVVGTVIKGSHGEYPGLEQRLDELGKLVDRMADQAEKSGSKRGLDLAVLPETAVTSPHGTARERSVPLAGKVREAGAAIARKHRCYLVLPLDLVEEGKSGPINSNAAVLFDRRGEVAGIYRKIHPVAWVGADHLEKGITAGIDTPVFDCDFGKLGIQICWDIQYPDGWAELARKGAEVVAWPTASPATILPAARASEHRYYVISSTWRDNAAIYEPTGMQAASVSPDNPILVHEIDLSYEILGWSMNLDDGQALTKKFGDRVGYHYSSREDFGLFWSNDPALTIADAVRAIRGESLDDQLARNRSLQERSRMDRAQPEVAVSLRKPDDHAEVVAGAGQTSINIHSASGIGSATLTRTGEQWPHALTLRLNLNGLESIKLASGDTALNGAWSSPDGPSRASRVTAVGEQPLADSDPSWFAITAIKPDVSSPPPASSGTPSRPAAWFEIKLPRSLLTPESKELQVEWVDFFR